jgi:isopentenyl-diphosphate delta-isomerase
MMGKDDTLRDLEAFRRREVSWDDELLILVDNDDRVTGYDTKLNVHLGTGQLHRAFSIFLVSPCERVLLQRRSAQKPLWPLYWSNSVCSHPRRGEQADTAALRRLKEELGVVAELSPLYQFQYSATFERVGSEHELCNVYAGCIPVDQPVTPNVNEIDDWEWVAFGEVEHRIDRHPQQFTPWMLMEWDRFRRDDYREFRRVIDRDDRASALG